MDLFQWLRNACMGNQQATVKISDIPHTSPVRKRCRFSGRVQGVGFRYEAMMLASQLGLTGWVRNEDDGTVVVEVEGEDGYIDEFLRVIQAVPRFDITNIQSEDLPLSEAEPSFKVLY